MSPVTVSLASVSDRLARRRTSPDEARDTFSIPPTTIRVGWAAIGPSQRLGGGGDLTVEELRTVVTQGIAEITEGAPAPEESGAQVVAELRQRVWGRDSRTIPPIRSGAIFAAYALGFLTQQDVRVSAKDRWTRLPTATGLCPGALTAHHREGGDGRQGHPDEDEHRDV